MGSPGMEMGAPGRPGLASSTWSWMMMLCAGSGVMSDGAEATTVTCCWTDTICWNCTADFWLLARAPTATSEMTVTKDGDSARS